MKQTLSVGLAVLLTFPALGAAQQAPPAGPQQQVSAPAAPQPVMLPGSLKILVLEGQGAINNVEKGLATPPVVEVRDRDDRPVEGATVVFRLPPSGASGAFADGKLTKSVTTNAQGQAIATGLIPNRTLGRMTIHVTASMGNRMGETDVAETNTPDRYAMATEATPHKGIRKKWIIIGAAAAAAIAVGVILGTRGGSSAASNPTVTITPGPVTIGQ